jgi:hypothetical protein
MKDILGACNRQIETEINAQAKEQCFLNSFVGSEQEFQDRD